jgi:hypothetical protein
MDLLTVSKAEVDSSIETKKLDPAAEANGVSAKAA